MILLRATPLQQSNVPSTSKSSSTKSMYQPVTINGQEIDLFKITCKYGVNQRGAQSHLRKKYGLSKTEAEELLRPYYEPIKQNTPTLKQTIKNLSEKASANASIMAQKRDELEKTGQTYCPKCLSTSISANQKGVGFVRGAFGLSLGVDTAMIAGGIGSKKVICTCLKRGHQWKAGQK